MKTALRNLIIFLSVLLLGSVLYFIVNIFNKKEKFSAKKINMNNNEHFTRNEQNIDIFKNISRDEAKKYGISQETYDAMINVFNNNEPPSKLVDALKNKPQEAQCIGKLMLKYTK
jgi:hypothetical protein